MWLSIIASVIAIIFLLRSIEVIHTGQPVLNGIVCLLALLSALFFLPNLVTPSMLNGFAWFVFIFSAGFVLLESIASLSRKIRRLPFLGLGSAIDPGAGFSEICKALDQMAQKHVGALVVIERKQSLQNFFESGFHYDGDIKAEVIASLFDKNSPVHDGAMIISNGRIKALKVILPLTTRADVPLGIGTRHRSAIGLTESTDAIALIASEERGMMSVAYQGALVAANSKDQLYELLKLALRDKPIA